MAIGWRLSMETTLDKFGRVVIPKEIRDDLSLKPGEVLQVEKSGDEVILKLLREEPALHMKEGVLVFSGIATGNLKDAIRFHREDHLKKLSTPVRK
jgi:AbrB family looped-hinge helix DNA binding protein